MDSAEDWDEAEEAGDLVSEEALLPGLTLVWEREDYPGAAISSAEPRERLSHRFIRRIMIPGLRLMTEGQLILEL